MAAKSLRAAVGVAAEIGDSAASAAAWRISMSSGSGGMQHWLAAGKYAAAAAATARGIMAWRDGRKTRRNSKPAAAWQRRRRIGINGIVWRIVQHGRSGAGSGSQ